MTTFIDFLDLLGESVQYTVKSQGMRFWVGVASGLALGAVCWAAASASGRLWNRRFHTKMIHHLLCACAALLTLVFCMIFVSSDFMPDAANLRVGRWSERLKEDRTWAANAFIEAWERVKRAGTEDFGGKPSPRENPNATVPITMPESKRIVAAVYSTAALQNFRQENAFIGSVVQPNAEIPQSALNDDVYEFFRTNPNSQTYPIERGIDMVVRVLKHEIEIQIPQIAHYSARLALALFLAVQVIVFVLLGFAAYRSLTVTR